MSLAIFDLDNTLIADDSDYLWGQYLVDLGVVDKDYYAQQNEKFYRQYKQGTLNIMEFLQFALRPLAQHEKSQLFQWRDGFIAEIIQPLLLKSAQDLVNKHRDRGDTLLVITATNRFVTEPIVKLYGIDHLLASTPECIDGKFTGKVSGIPCFQDGKVTQLRQWLKNSTATLEDSWFYSDSHNDIPLLNLVTNPVAVDPDAQLANYAAQSGWPIITLRTEHLPEHHFK